MFARLVRQGRGFRGSARQYATRMGEDSPFDHLPPRANKGWVNWKVTGLFFCLGVAVGYNESVYNLYEKVTYIDPEAKINVELLPRQLEYKLKHLPLYEKLNHPKNELWIKLSSWENLDHNPLDGHPKYTIKHQDEYTAPSMTTSTLAKPGGILIKPAIFHNVDTDEGVTIVHLGNRLTGYPFLVHGGMIATLLNETFKRNALLNRKTSSLLKDDFMVEHVEINYKAPTKANQFLVVKTRQREGTLVLDDAHVVNLELVIEDTKGKVLVKSNAVLRDTGRASDRIAAENNRRWGIFCR